jgi:hypothetical protein
MKLLAIALLSFALQVCSASTGKAPATPGDPVQKIVATYGAQNSGAGADRGETLIAQSSAPSLDNSSKGQAGSGNGAGEPTQTVKVSDLPPLSITKDWSDRAYWLFTLILVAVGGLQAFLYWGSLRAIERQAIQMEHQTGILEKSVALAEKNAETARQNIEMFVSRERAHLRVDLMPLEWPLPPGAARLKYQVTLHGATEAYIVTSCARAELMDSLEPQDDAKWWPAMSIPQVISPNNRVVEGVVEGIYPKMNLEQADIDALDAGKKFIHFRGFIRYDDVFGTERMTRFRRAWELSSARNPDGTRSGHWSKRGSPKDNSET